LLGDTIATTDAGKARISRWLVDASGRIGAALGIVGEGNVWVSLNSSAGEDVFATTRALNTARLADPPFLHRLVLPPELSLAELIRRHAAFRVDAADRIATLADLERTSSRTLAWRNAEPPDALLDADLRALLGANYDRIGKLWAHKLRDELPRATARY
jgi:hypothetical protein